MHPDHNKEYLESLWTEIETLQWVLAQILTYDWVFRYQKHIADALSSYRGTLYWSRDSENVGNVTNNKTFTNTYLSDELIVGRGKGTIETTDGQSIDWISSDLGRPSDNQWVFHGLMLFNNTQGESLSFLNPKFKRELF